MTTDKTNIEKDVTRKQQLIYNATLIVGRSREIGYLLIEGERIKVCEVGTPPERMMDCADVVINAGMALLLPGMIDSHVHFREPGLTHKATIESESRAALAGGITSYLEMPNTKPPTISQGNLFDKLAIAAEKSAANYGFFIGATADNIDELRSVDYRFCPGIKLFMGSSTGKMAVDNDRALEEIFSVAGDTIPIVVHAEDDKIIARNKRAILKNYPSADDVPVEEHSRIRSAEACLSSAERAVTLAEKYATRLHLAHISTEAEIKNLLSEGPIDYKRITAEVTPLHLTFSEDDYATCGSRIKVNPAVKSSADRQALYNALYSCAIDTIATDHAPHLLSEKVGGALNAASGAPMLQFAVPLLLSFLPPEVLIDKMAAAPAKLFGIEDRGSLAPGNYADVILVDYVSEYTVSQDMILSPCGWSPLGEGQKLNHKVVKTWVNGVLAYDHGEFIDVHAAQKLTFKHQ